MTCSTVEATSAIDFIVTGYLDVRSAPTRYEIECLAYQFYEMRGKRDGHDVDDWLSAERELIDHYK